MNSKYLRGYFQNKAGLTPAQASLVSDTAAALAPQLAQYDAHAAELRKQRHVVVQTKQLRGEAIPPVPAEILGLQAGRDALILQARNQLRQSLEEEVFARLDAYARTAPWEKPLIPVPPVQAQVAQKAGATVPDRIYYMSLFHSIAYLKAQAEEERKLGLNQLADNLLGLVQSQSGLTKQEFQIVDAAATRYSQKRGESAKSAEAAETSYRRLALEMLARDGTVTASPEALAAWSAVSDVQKQFENETDNAVKDLRGDLGEETFSRLGSFLKRKMTVKAAGAKGVNQ